MIAHTRLPFEAIRLRNSNKAVKSIPLLYSFATGSSVSLSLCRVLDNFPEQELRHAFCRGTSVCGGNLLECRATLHGNHPMLFPVRAKVSLALEIDLNG